jgi:hypothetical protein
MCENRRGIQRRFVLSFYLHVKNLGSSDLRLTLDGPLFLFSFVCRNKDAVKTLFSVAKEFVNFLSCWNGPCK